MSTDRSLLRTILASPFFRWGAGLSVAALSLYLAARQVTLESFLSAIRQARWEYIGLALLCVALNNLIKTARWQLLLGKNPANPRFASLLLSLLAGQMLNLFFPGRVGELHRIYAIGGLGAGRSFTLGTVALEKLLDLAAYAWLLGLLLAAIPLPGWMNSSAVSAGLAIAGLAALAALLILPRRSLEAMLNAIVARLPARWQGPIAARLTAALASLDVLHSRRARLLLAIYTALVWATATLVTYTVLLALDIRLPISASLLVLAALQAGISVPAVPGRLGVFEVLCVWSLAVFGINDATGLGFGALLHAITMVPLFVFGLGSFWLLMWMGNRKIAAPAARPASGSSR